ncbi:MAG: gephyrin-like molybdotransferase Glp, partial [Pseudomonadota bacterium]
MSLLSVSDALEQIRAEARAMPTEACDLADADGRVLAEPVLAAADQPPFAASAMDGYAVKARDVRDHPATLKVVGEAAAGRGFRGTVGDGEAARIFTGAPIPDGADAIVIQENTTRDGDHVSVVEGQPDPGHVRPRANDFAAGQTLIAAGHLVNPRTLTLAAAAGHPSLSVKRKPVVAIIATGDELVMPGTTPGPDQIVCSNPFGIAALVTRAGGTPRVLGIARDTRDDLNRAFDAAADADVVVTIGGASVGDHDLVAPVLESRGVALAFWKIAMRPGKPLMFGTGGDQCVIGLPGNPVSSLVCTRLFVRAALRQMLGQSPEPIANGQARLGADIGANGPRMHFMRAVE